MQIYIIKRMPKGVRFCYEVKTKRELIGADASGDEELFTEKSVLLRRQTEEYKRFSKLANLPSQPERYGVMGYGRSISGKSVWKVKKGLTSKGNGGIINAKTYKTFGLNFVSHRDDLYRLVSKVKPYKNYEDIAFHADRESFLVLDPETQDIIERISPQKLSELLKNSNNYVQGKSIRLLSCQSGYGENSLAQQLSDELGVEVIAPTEILAIDTTGEMFISDNLTLIDMWCDGEDVKQTGKWKKFKPKR